MSQPNEIKLFRVTATYHTVIAAKSKEEAEKQAAWVVRREDDAEPVKVLATYVTSSFDLPEGWNPSCMPFGDRDPENPDKTIREYLRQPLHSCASAKKMQNLDDFCCAAIKTC